MSEAGYIREVMKPLEPVPTGVEPKLPSLSGIEAVVFDIYGTLLVSAAGDIGLAGEGRGLSAMGAALESITGRGGSQDPREWETGYEALVVEHSERRREQGVEFPEVDIREVWRDLGERVGCLELSDREIMELSLRYECALNPCWSMPGARDVLNGLKACGFTLGIISNAQFYTSLVFDSLVGISLSGDLFENSMSVFSFEEREGKPSQGLYEKARKGAEASGISPDSVFYLGNDCIKDICPAIAAGFRTGLFAGDKRSLRTGNLDLKSACESAHAVLTDLRQLGDVLSIPL